MHPDPPLPHRTSVSKAFMTICCSTPKLFKTHRFERQKTLLHSISSKFPQPVRRNPSSLCQGKAIGQEARVAVLAKDSRRPSAASEAGPANKSEARDQTTSMAAALLPRRRLGATGLEISALGFGASPLGSVFQDIDEDEGVAAVHEAVRLGCNFFDTSPFYGITRSEQVLGRAFKDIPRDKLVVATKCGRYGEEEFDFSAERVTASVKESLKRLNLDYVDIIHCHDIEHGSLDQIVNETLPALVKVKEAGLARFIGITGLPLKIYKYVIERAPPNSVDVILSYCHNSLNDQSLAELIPYLKDKDIGIISASPLSMGLFTNQGPPAWHPAPQDVKELCKTAVSHSSSKGANLAKIAIAESLRNEDVSTTLVGMCTREQVAANVQAALEGLNVVPSPEASRDAEVLSEVKEILKPIMGKTWPSGRPENN